MKARLLPLLAISFATAAAAETLAPEQLDFFEKKIRPVLAEHCYKCHSEKSEKIRGGLVLDTREGIRRGGDTGPAVAPGDIAGSLLIAAIRHTDKDVAMPPEKDGPKLADSVIKDFEAWVKMGAPDPRDGAAKVVAKYDDAAARRWWAFQPIARPETPAPRDAAWARTDIDRFLLAGLEAKGLRPVADAQPATLLRRLHFDLTGLPPSPEEIDAFLAEWRSAGADPQPAIEKVVDRLLASPRFGERWGRHWLDVARYAESSGKDVNIAFPHAWRYRDYVIGAFNADKPYDRFIAEQIAGDLLEPTDDKDRAEKLIATGFLALGPKGLNEQNARQFALDVADEQIDTVSQAVLGLTVACARCHDHKFDPVSQREYYALAGIFLSTESRYGTALGIQNRRASELHELPKGAGLPVIAQPLDAEARARLQAQLRDLQDDLPPALGGTARPTDRNDPAAQLRRLRAVGEAGAIRLTLAAYEADGAPKALAMGVQDRTPPSPGYFIGERERAEMRERFARRFGVGGGGGAAAPFATVTDSPLFARGEVDKPGEKVPRGFPAVLTLSTAPTIPRDASGRRELAEWLVTPTNPLTARVMVNRVWHWLFGQGLVASVDNFGTTGQAPSDPALLDHLASEFIGDGWSVKRLIQRIVTSRAYRLSSGHDDERFAADPQNALVWRMNPRRLDAECLRDAMLAASGQLDLTPPLASLVARAGDGAVGGPRTRGIGEEAILHAGGAARSVYLPVARDIVPDALAVFDFAETSLVTGARETTNVPSQALYLLNSTFVSLQAQALADRVLARLPGAPDASFDSRLDYAFRLVFGRAPGAAERESAADFLSRFPSDWEKGGEPPLGMRDADREKAAWTSLCRALFATAEFRYLD